MEQDDGPGLEQLDEPCAGAMSSTRSRRPELLLGLALVLAIVGWGGWDWWTQGQRLDNYRAGQRAGAGRDWDSARTYFLAAGGYGDAPVRAAQAASAVAARDAAYNAAAAAARQQDWLGTMNALAKVDGIQPGYKDSAGRAALVRQQVYSGALSGTIALRSTAQPPGLYVYTAAGWQSLAGSDLASQVQAVNGCDFVIYDVPSPLSDSTAGTAPVTPTLQPRTVTPPPRLFRAAYSDGHQLRTVTLDPRLSLYDDGLLCARSGVLAPQRRPDPSLADDWRNYTFSARQDFSYQGLTDPHVGQVVPSDDGVVGIASSQDRLVAVRLGTGSKSSGEDSPAPFSSYYIVKLRDSITTTVYETDSLPMYAVLSPDSTQMLVADRVAAGAGERRSFTLVNLNGGQPPVRLASWALDRATVNTSDFYAQFLTRGPLRGKIMFSSRATDSSRVWLVDNVVPGKVLWTSQAEPGSLYPSWSELPNGVLIAWTNSDCKSPEDSATFIGSDYQARQVDLKIRPAWQLDTVFIRKDRLVYRSGESCWPDKRAYDLASVPLTVLDGRPAAGTLLNSTAVQTNSIPRSFGWSLGAELFAFIKDDALHVARYDGSGDTVLETGVKTLYELQRPDQ